MTASILGSNQMMFAVIATSVTLIAVFVPLTLIEGTVGLLFVEFGVVLAIAVAVSTFIALYPVSDADLTGARETRKRETALSIALWTGCSRSTEGPLCGRAEKGGRPAVDRRCLASLAVGVAAVGLLRAAAQ